MYIFPRNREITHSGLYFTMSIVRNELAEKEKVSVKTIENQQEMLEW